MRYQLQSYGADQGNRKILDEAADLKSEAEVSSWSAKAMAEKGNQVPEGHQAFIIAENHPFFIQMDGNGNRDAVMGTHEQAPKNVPEFSGEAVDFDTVQQYERQMETERRKERIKTNAELLQHLQKFRSK